MTKGFKILTEKDIMELPRPVLIDLACIRLNNLEEKGLKIIIYNKHKYYKHLKKIKRGKKE